MTSMGKKEWNSSTDWMRVAAARGSSSRGADRVRASQAESLTVTFPAQDGVVSRSESAREGLPSGPARPTSELAIWA